MKRKKPAIAAILTLEELYWYVSTNELFSITIDEAERWYGMTKSHYYALRRNRTRTKNKYKTAY
jgi:hypothetical protein